jgi:hypothetical protein
VEVLLTFCSVWPGISNLLISASWVAGIKATLLNELLYAKSVIYSDKLGKHWVKESETLHFSFFFFTFINILLENIHCTKGFHCYIYITCMWCTLILLTPSFLSSPFYDLMCFITLFSFVHVTYFNHSSYHPLLFSFLSSIGSPTPKVPLLHSCTFFFFLVRSRFHIWEKMWHLSFYFWFISLSMTISSSTHFHTNDIIPLFFMAE